MGSSFDITPITAGAYTETIGIGPELAKVHLALL